MRTLMRTLTSTVFIAAAAGFVFAHYGTAAHKASLSPLNRQASGKSFTIKYSSDWRLAPLHAVPNLPLDGSVTLVPTQMAKAELIVGTTHPLAPSTLPVALRSTLPASVKPAVVNLGGSSFYRWLDLTPTGAGVTESVYVLPTTLGAITAVCAASRPSSAFTGTCERLLATLRVTVGRPLSVIADTGYALELNHILAELNTVRTAAGRGLRSGNVKVRAAAAGQLAAADTRAATAAHHIMSVTVSLANLPLETALRMNAAAYRALGASALAGDVPGYQRAEAQIARSERALDAVYAQLRSFGYTIG